MTPDQLLNAAKKAKSTDTRRKFMARYKVAVKAERLTAQIEGCGGCVKAQKTKRPKGWEGPTKANLALVGDSRSSLKGKDEATLKLGMKAASLEYDKTTRIYPLCLLHHRKVIALVNPLVVALMSFRPIRNPLFVKGRFNYDIRPPNWYRRRNNMSGLIAALAPIGEVINGWKELPLDDIPELSDASIAHAIEHQGWVKVYSAVIGDTLVATNREPSMLPPDTSKYPIYTLDELARIRVLADQKVMDTRMLRATHEVKKAFGRSLVTV